ncbi:glutamate synthase [Pseudomonas sp. PIC25]|uniref:chaperone NapD n=1 Tax=Pseudomonas sp. PIC25 TaxID=1958773 RepID=UPI000BAB8100|nr:chaperone NapD [Pseudomonas sp. PIC25]PAU62789.1 glutamate synthase [Pseudomonas sp. PIC25]
MDDVLHIASLLVHCRPEALAALKDNLRLLPDLELHQESPAGKLVVVLEAEHESRILERLDQIQSLPGVLNAVLVYHELLDHEGEAR